MQFRVPQHPKCVTTLTADCHCYYLHDAVYVVLLLVITSASIGDRSLDEAFPVLQHILCHQPRSEDLKCYWHVHNSRDIDHSSSILETAHKQQQQLCVHILVDHDFHLCTYFYTQTSHALPFSRLQPRRTTWSLYDKRLQWYLNLYFVEFRSAIRVWLNTVHIIVSQGSHFILGVAGSLLANLLSTQGKSMHINLNCAPLIA